MRPTVCAPLVYTDVYTHWWWFILMFVHIAYDVMFAHTDDGVHWCLYKWWCTLMFVNIVYDVYCLYTLLIVYTDVCTHWWCTLILVYTTLVLVNTDVGAHWIWSCQLLYARIPFKDLPKPQIFDCNYVGSLSAYKSNNVLACQVVLGLFQYLTVIMLSNVSCFRVSVYVTVIMLTPVNSLGFSQCIWQ